MKTPAGRECRYYYEDFHRGRNKQECRLLKQSAGPRWKPSDCSHCLIPDILWANASEYLALHAEIRLGVLGIGRRIAVTAWCTKHDREIADPYVGCTLCAQERPDIANWTETDA